MRPRRNTEEFLRRLFALTDLCAQRSMPSMPSWWREKIAAYYRSGKRRMTVRKGRRVYASTCVAPQLAVAEMLWGEHPHIPGTPPLAYAFLSVRRDEAANRLRGVRALLDLLGEPYDERGETIELRNRPAIFTVITASYKASIGETVAFAWCDEVAFWNDGGSNPAEQVFGLLMPALATIPDARVFIVSSVFGTDDFHARQFDRGDTEDQFVAFGRTWDINPDLTEAETHKLEPDHRLWAMAYAAEPSASISSALDPADLAACYALTPKGTTKRSFLSTDFSSLRGDDTTYLAGRDTTAGEIVVQEVGGWNARELRNLTMKDVVGKIAARAKVWGCDRVFGDQREEAAIRSLFAEHGITFVSYAWSATSKEDAIQLLRRLMRERRVALPEHDTLRRQLANMKARLLPSGQTRYELNGQDYASSLVTLAHAAVDGKVVPLRQSIDLRVYTVTSERADPGLGPRADIRPINRSGNLFKRDPSTGQILRDPNGNPIWK